MIKTLVRVKGYMKSKQDYIKEFESLEDIEEFIEEFGCIHPNYMIAIYVK